MLGSLVLADFSVIHKNPIFDFALYLLFLHVKRFCDRQFQGICGALRYFDGPDTVGKSCIRVPALCLVQLQHTVTRSQD